MPIHEFTCNNCRNEFEKLFKNNNENNQFANCPKCGSVTPRNLKPSRASILFKDSQNNFSPQENNELPNPTAQAAAIITPYNGTADLRNVYIKGVDTGIRAVNTKLKGENITFDNVKIGIEHSNSEIEIKNLNAINSKKKS